MTHPQRIQLRSTAGFNLQAASMALNGLPCIKVDRGGKGTFGNPFTVAHARDAGWRGTDAVLAAGCVSSFREWLTARGGQDLWWGRRSAATREIILTGLPLLRGKNLACWCKPGCPCHADVLLKLANA